VLDRLPIRWRLAVTSAALTFAILCGFAVVVGELTQRRIRDDFRRQVQIAADELQDQVYVQFNPLTGHYTVQPQDLELFARAEHAAIRVLSADGVLLRTTPQAPNLGPPFTTTGVVKGYRVETREVAARPYGHAYVQYGRPISDLNDTLERVRLFLIFGVVGGAAVALLAGVMLARRAMRPIARLTETAEEIRRTRDPARTIEQPHADDEIAQLASTLDGMLRALGESQEETRAALARQREFVADASHELRTPLTSVLANLELLADTLDGDQGDAARSALRSAQRMRRLVADLLMLARADARREAPRRPVDLSEVLIESAAEAGATGTGHELSIDAKPVWVDGVRDDLHRLALNLLENALRHTPPGTTVRARAARDGGEAVLVIEDEGPGIPEAMRDRIFDRFVRGAGDRGGSFGLGLAIVRAVAEQHGGSVTVEDARPGARFIVRIPAAGAAGAEQDERHPAATPAAP
jgi:signal transduction histidine kinase